MNKTSLDYGLCTGLIISLTIVIASSVMGAVSELTYEKYQRAEQFGSVRYLVLIIGIVAAMLAHRKMSPGAVTYRSAITAGIWAALACAVIVGLAEAAFVMMNPGFMDAASNAIAEGKRQAGGSQADIDAMKSQMQSMAWMGTPFGMGLFFLFETGLIGTVVALIAGFFVKRKG